MVKKTKKNSSLRVGDIFAVELADKSFSIVQLCFVYEIDDYLSLTFGFFDLRENNIDSIKENIEIYNLNNPIIIATLNENPIKQWKYMGNRNINYLNIDFEKGITGTWGWYNNIESGIYPKLESYFGILPWDLYMGKAHIENYLIDKNKIPENIKLLNEFTKEEAEKLCFISLVEYSGRIKELK